LVPDFFEDTDKFLEEFGAAGATLPVDVYQTETSVVVKAALPGFDPAQIEVSVDNNVLTIQAKTEHKTEVDEKNYYRREMRSGSMCRSVSLPTSVVDDKAEASYENGVLTVTLPKASERTSKRITIKTTSA